MSDPAIQSLESAAPSVGAGNGNQLEEVGVGPREPTGTPPGGVADPDAGDPPAALGRIAWAITTVVFAVAGLVLLLEGYDGYASVTFAVAVAAGINLV